MYELTVGDYTYKDFRTYQEAYERLQDILISTIKKRYNLRDTKQTSSRHHFEVSKKFSYLLLETSMKGLQELAQVNVLSIKKV